MENTLGKPQLKKLYKSLLPSIREVAKKCGYAIGEHGSMTRDMDLIAVPWVDKPLNESTLIKRICNLVDGFVVRGNVEKPNGRKAYTIHLNGYKSKTRWAVFIDLSITPKY